MKPLLLLLLLLVSCQRGVTEYKGISHTIPYRLLIASSHDPKAVENLIAAVFAEVDAHYNNWNPDSEISKLNRLEAGQRCPLSPKLEDLLRLVDRMYTVTEGRFDPTVEPLRQLCWGRLPSDEELAPLVPAIGWHNVHLSEGFFWKDHDLTSIDLGGISKGHAVDLLTEGLQKLGCDNAYVDWGGEIRVLGRHSTKRPWRVGLGENLTVELLESAIATSGDAYQCWEVGGTTYFHILDPKTHSPLRKGEITQVSVQTSSCAVADALATSLMLFQTKEAATSWAEAHPELTCWIVFRKSLDYQ